LSAGGRGAPPVSKRAKAELSALETRIGHVFVDGELLAHALTHVSAPITSGAGRAQSYQRLEFLGDRVLGLVVADMLYVAYPNATEGELSMRLAKLVRRETCASVAAEWDVGPHVVMGQGEARAGGRKKAAILSDICESLIGAVFIDGGFIAAQGLVTRSWKARMAADLEPERDAKTAVQEWAQARAIPAPRYVEVGRSGPAHEPSFIMQVELDGYEPERGEASSKRYAEQAAAQAFLNRWATP
jgi:ribonuclease-3